MKIAIFFPGGGSGKLLHIIVETLLGDTSIQGPTPTGSMHYELEHEIGWEKLPFYEGDNRTHAKAAIVVYHIAATDIKANIGLMSDYKIIYIYTTNLLDCIKMANRNMYKFFKTDYHLLSKEYLSMEFGIDAPKQFEDIPAKVIENCVAEKAIEHMKFRPLNRDIDNVLQIDYNTMFENDNIIDKISKFLDLYENIEHAKLIFSRYIAAQNNFPEYATIESIKNFKPIKRKLE